VCTVTFIARKRGYLLGMNRDEKLTRPMGLAPAQRVVGGRSVLCPSEPGGGTWIALNDVGVTFALVNWYSVSAHGAGRQVSRGQVVNAVSLFDSPVDATCVLTKLPLPRINPFRLIGIFPARKEIIEWRWDLKELSQVRHHWRARQWISSSFDEPKAHHVRSQAFRAARRQKSFGNVNWLRRLHRSHHPEKGPFSTCMHRADATTVSYTEIHVLPLSLTMHHHLGCPHPQQIRSLAGSARSLSRSLDGQPSPDPADPRGLHTQEAC